MHVFMPLRPCSCASGCAQASPQVSTSGCHAVPKHEVCACKDWLRISYLRFHATEHSRAVGSTVKKQEAIAAHELQPLTAQTQATTSQTVLRQLTRLARISSRNSITRTATLAEQSSMRTGAHVSHCRIQYPVHLTDTGPHISDALPRELSDEITPRKAPACMKSKIGTSS